MHSVIFIVGLILDIRCSASSLRRCVCIYVCSYLSLFMSVSVPLLVCICLPVSVSAVSLYDYGFSGCLWLCSLCLYLNCSVSPVYISVSVGVCLHSTHLKFSLLHLVIKHGTLSYSSPACHRRCSHLWVATCLLTIVCVTPCLLQPSEATKLTLLLCTCRLCLLGLASVSVYIIKGHQLN